MRLAGSFSFRGLCWNQIRHFTSTDIGGMRSDTVRRETICRISLLGVCIHSLSGCSILHDLAKRARRFLAFRLCEHKKRAPGMWTDLSLQTYTCLPNQGAETASLLK